MTRVVVDTSIFVDFFRGRPTGSFEGLLRANAVLLSQYVRLELLQGLRRDEARRVGELLRGIPQVPHDARIFAVAEKMVHRVKGTGLNLGLVDLLIAAEATQLRAAVLSSDGVFDRLSSLGLVRAAPDARG